MKKPPSKRRTEEMREEYDFSGGVRGKYVDRYRRGTVTSQTKSYRNKGSKD